MNALKFILIFFIIALISAAAYIINYRQDLVPPALAKFTPTISGQLLSTSKQIESTIGTVKDSRWAPLGQSIQTSQIFAVDENSTKPMHQKALEFARYEYCKQVVRDYEITPTPSASSTISQEQ